MKNQSHKTAISRRTLSAPTRYLMKAGLVTQYSKRWLDYGCGKGFDADTLQIDKFDPHFFPEKPGGKFDIITCNYVLNVIESKFDRFAVLFDILARLKKGGTAFIAIRRDVKKAGYTNRGTYQENVRLKLPVVKETAAFVIYRLDKH